MPSIIIFKEIYLDEYSGEPVHREEHLPDGFYPPEDPIIYKVNEAPWKTITDVEFKVWAEKEI